VIAALSAAMTMMAAPAPPLYVPPGPAAKRSGRFECRLVGEGEVEVRLSGELGIAPAAEKGTLRGRVRMASAEAPELDGIYVAEWEGSYFSFWRSEGDFVSMHFHHGPVGDRGAAVVKRPGISAGWYAGLCSHSLSHKAGAVIR
jgi:hypothetical protein